MKKFEIQSKTSIEHPEIGNLFNFHFHFCIKNENKYSILNFVFQFIMKTKWHFGYADYTHYGKDVLHLLLLKTCDSCYFPERERERERERGREREKL